MPPVAQQAIGRAWRQRLPGRVRSLHALRSPREVLLFVRVAAFAATVPWLMRLPLPRLATLVDRPPRHRRAREAAAEVERLERLVALAPRVARPLVRTGCLTRGVTLYRFLRRAGLDVELRFGLDTRAADADGHCWLTLAGEPFLEREDPRRFAEIWRLPLARRGWRDPRDRLASGRPSGARTQGGGSSSSSSAIAPTEDAASAQRRPPPDAAGVSPTPPGP